MTAPEKKPLAADPIDKNDADKGGHEVHNLHPNISQYSQVLG